MSVVGGQIGSNQFTLLELEPVEYGNVIRSMKRSGTDYHAYKYLGREYPEQDLVCQQEFTTHLQAIQAALTYNAYIGTNQQIIRGGQTYGTYKFLKPAGSDYPRISPVKYTPKMVGSVVAALFSGWIVQSVHRVQRQS
jgi:hypothetical protein